MSESKPDSAGKAPEKPTQSAAAPAASAAAPAPSPANDAEALAAKETFDKALARVKGLSEDPVMRDVLGKKGLEAVDVEKQAALAA